YASLQITQAVTNNNTASQCDGQFSGYCIKQTGSRFATIAVLLRGMGAIKNAVQHTPGILYQIIQAGMHGFEVFQLKKTPPQTRLISGNHDLMTCLAESGNGLNAAGNRN